MMIESLGRSSIKMGKELRMAQSSTPPQTQEQRAQEFVSDFNALRNEIRKVIVGHDEVINHVLTGLFAGGHVLLEGVPGLGKTLLIKTLAESLDLTFSRIQFTPDLMPGDIMGTNMIVEDESERKHFQFHRGPIFAHILLADEVNRATPKTQSALLEGMQEGAVTVSGHANPLPQPFFVLATQNPIEMEGTYPLPEAQLDRFLFKLRVQYPALEDLTEIINRTTQVREVNVQRVMTGPRALSFRELVREVPIAAHVRDLAAHIVLATHPQWERSPEQTRRFVRYGASPRGAQALVLGAKVRALSEGRYNVSVEDLRAMALPSLRHRIILNFEGEAEAVDVDRLITQIIEAAENMSATEKEVFLR
jgi:MoxR-like ATPase